MITFLQSSLGYQSLKSYVGNNKLTGRIEPIKFILRHTAEMQIV